MNTKSALIIAVAIVIGFSIEPILERVDFSDPHDRLIKVVAIGVGSDEEYAYEFSVKAGTLRWTYDKELRSWFSRNNDYQPADAYALKAVMEMYGH
jgi:hypothetical protein